MKIFELTPLKFLFLTIVSHLGFLYTLVWGQWQHIVATFVMAYCILLFASVTYYHRYLSHRSWNPPEWYKIFASFFGILSFTGSTISRTVIHRQHHGFVDDWRDPHSPFLVSPWKIYFPYFNQKKINLSLARDIATQKMHKFIHEYYILLIIVAYLIVWVFSNNLWAVAIIIAPGALCWLNVCILNIYGHKQKGGSNSKLLSFITLGEGNHKYHHDHPDDPNPGQGYHDPSWVLIRILSKK